SLSAAAHLCHAGVETRVFGAPMQFWREHMPAGMLLRSRMRSSHIANPERDLMLGDFSRATHRQLSTPLTLTEFVDYGQWFQSQVAPDVDGRRVQRVEIEAGQFKVTLQDGERIFARRVVVAAGIGPFAWRPPPFDVLPRKLVSHSSEHQSFAQFRG